MKVGLIMLMIMLNNLTSVKGALFRFGVSEEDFRCFYASCLCCLASLHPLFKGLHLGVGV